MTCAAGSRNESLFSCVDSFGNVVKQGGAALRGQCTSLVFDKQLESQQCEVAHQGNGMYALSYCLSSAGPYEVSQGHSVVWTCCKHRSFADVGKLLH